MNTTLEEKRSQGPLVTFIDLLFLLVAFLVLVIFFLQTQQNTSDTELEKTQQRLAAAENRKSAMEETLAALAPVIEQFSIQKKIETKRRQAAAAREIRQRRRETYKLEYQILANGKIGYRGRQYTLERFRVEVVGPLRQNNWVSFRASATEEIPFGTVVKYRRALLNDGGEFDTYWDNVSAKK